MCAFLIRTDDNFLMVVVAVAVTDMFHELQSEERPSTMGGDTREAAVSRLLFLPYKYRFILPEEGGVRCDYKNTKKKSKLNLRSRIF